MQIKNITTKLFATKSNYQIQYTVKNIYTLKIRKKSFDALHINGSNVLFYLLVI